MPHLVVLVEGGLVAQTWVAPEKELAVEFAETLVNSGYLSPEDHNLVVEVQAAIKAPASESRVFVPNERIWTWMPERLEGDSASG